MFIGLIQPVNKLGMRKVNNDSKIKKNGDLRASIMMKQSFPKIITSVLSKTRPERKDTSKNSFCVKRKNNDKMSAKYSI